MSLSLHNPEKTLLRRLPRTLSESGGVFPDWRYQQAYLYDYATQASQNYSILNDEDDDLVVKLYAFLRYSSCGNEKMDRYISYALDAEEENGTFGVASRIKSYVCAGLSVAEIARRCGCSSETIEVYEKLFFDIRDKVSCIDYVMSIIFPLVIARGENPIKRRERFFMANAMMFGIEGLDLAMRRTVDISETAYQKMSLRFRTLGLSSAIEYLIAAKTRGNPQPEDYDRAIAYMQTPREDTSKDEGKLIDFASSYAKSISSKMGLSVDDDQILKPFIEIGMQVREVKNKLHGNANWRKSGDHVIDLIPTISLSNNNAGNISNYTIES